MLFLCHNLKDVLCQTREKEERETRKDRQRHVNGDVMAGGSAFR